MDYFTSDHHFSHKNILGFAGRPWDNTHDMNKQLIENWNSVVGNKDRVFYLGDFSFASVQSTKSILERLNGEILFVPGNHDKRGILEIIPNVLPLIYEYRVPTNQKNIIVLCHYPMVEWNRSFTGSLHLHGHCHGRGENGRNRFDVGIDNVAKFLPDGTMNPKNYRPVSLKEILEINGWQ